MKFTKHFVRSTETKVCYVRSLWFRIANNICSKQQFCNRIAIGRQLIGRNHIFIMSCTEHLLHEKKLVFLQNRIVANNFKFSYLTSALYLNGDISRDGKFFWCTNTWWIVNKGAANTFSNYEYLGYTFSLKKSQSITPLVGAIHSWRFDKDVDLAAGFYYSWGNMNLYIWGNDLLESHPRLVVGLDFVYGGR